MDENETDAGPAPTSPKTPMVSDDYQITLADGWVEETFERGTYGPENTDGLSIQFSAGREAEIHVVPVEYEVVGRRRRIQGLESDTEFQIISDESVLEAHRAGGHVYEPCLFAVQAHYTPISSPELAIYTLTTDADDALAAACWLSHATDPMGPGKAIDRVILAQEGGDPDHYGIDYPTDEQRFEDALVDEPNHCFYSGRTTRSHIIRLPFRYAPLLEGYPENVEELPAVPPRIRGLRVAVSHIEWQDRDLSEGSLTEPMNRLEEGVYQLTEDVAKQVNGFPR